MKKYNKLKNYRIKIQFNKQKFMNKNKKLKINQI